jgi:hypothetical protein
MEVSEYLNKKKCYIFLCLVLVYLIPGQVFSQLKYDSIRVFTDQRDNIDSIFYRKGYILMQKKYASHKLQSICSLSSKNDSIYFDQFYEGLDNKIRQVLFIWDSVNVGAVFGEETYSRYYFCTEVYEKRKLSLIYYRELMLTNGIRTQSKERYNRHGHFRYRIDVITSTKGRQRKKIHFARINYQSLQVDWLKTSEMCP